MDLKKDFEYRYFDSKYGKLHYAHHVGTGPARIFLHGFVGSMKSWDEAWAVPPGRNSTCT